jgi:Uma2 family endonuclease
MPNVEALKIQTIDDLLASPDEHVELIGGEIQRRPAARFEHSRAQSRAASTLGPFDGVAGPGGWWTATEVSVAYETHECPSHDIAGWRRERLPQPPTGIVEERPDWVCVIVSPGHERKDSLYIPLVLQRHQVPYYWLIWPEDRALIAHQLDAGYYRVIVTLKDQGRARIPPFDAIEVDLAYLPGID